MNLRYFVAISWSALTTLLAGFALLKKTTTAGDLNYVPSFLVGWLDRNYDFRTFLMTILVALVPCMLLANGCEVVQRRFLLFIITSLLLAMEFAQIWIPTRGFGLPDLLYTIAGAGLVEICASLWQRSFAQKRAKGKCTAAEAE